MKSIHTRKIVRMKESFKLLVKPRRSFFEKVWQWLTFNVELDHIEEFGHCIGVVQDETPFDDTQQYVDVLWHPSMLHYMYDFDQLEELPIDTLAEGAVVEVVEEFHAYGSIVPKGALGVVTRLAAFYPRTNAQVSLNCGFTGTVPNYHLRMVNERPQDLFVDEHT